MSVKNAPARILKKLHLFTARTHSEENIMKNFAIGLLLGSFGIFLGGGTAAAATTGILPGPETPLVGAGGILDQIYGLGNLQRIDDDFDQIWFPANGTASTTAKFAAFTQDVGYIPQNNDGMFNSADFVHLFNVPGGTEGIGRWTERYFEFGKR
jgi:hypothetical protein